jgi:hypothetical protein
MIILAESNFVLELAFQQEERDEVERLVVMAEAREVELVIPACALFEPYEAQLQAPIEVLKRSAIRRE